MLESKYIHMHIHKYTSCAYVTMPSGFLLSSWGNDSLERLFRDFIWGTIAYRKIFTLLDL